LEPRPESRMPRRVLADVDISIPEAISGAKAPVLENVLFYLGG
jgi:hypothetical protein